MAGQGQDGLAARIARFAIASGDFPASVRREAKRILLDQIACQLAAAPLPWSMGYLAAEQHLGGTPAATVIYHGTRLRLDQVAMVNGAFGQGAEFDDTHLRSSTHSGAVIVPTVLAIAEMKGLGGRAVLDAIVVGIETIIRLSTSVAPQLHERGHHVPASVGPFGAAAAASRLLGLDREVAGNAIAIAASHSTGLLEFTQSGGSIKRGHCGIAAMAGVRSALLARHGITGPTAALEGARGFFRCFAGSYDVAIANEGWGSEFIFLEMGYKPMTSAFPAHAPLEAIGDLIDEHGLKPDMVERIVIGTSTHSRHHVGVIRNPRDITDAHYSVAFGAAVRFYRGGNGFFDYREEDLGDPRFLALQDKVEVVHDEIAEDEKRRFNSRGAVVTITTTDGRRLEKRIRYSKGHPMNPLSDGDLEKKFRETVTPRLGSERAERLIEVIADVESLENAGALIALTLRH